MAQYKQIQNFESKNQILRRGGIDLRAAVFHTPQQFRIEEVPYPRLEPDGVIVKVKDCGICGSDLHFFNRWRQDGAIRGHEFSGDIVDIGAEVTGVKKGDRVVAASGRGCGTCYWCRQGQYIHCSQLKFVGVGIQGAFAEYVSIPAFSLDQYAARLPDPLTYEEGATAEPLAVAWYAVSQVNPQPEDTVVVIGLGIIGLFIIQILRSMGVKQIIASGRREKRLHLAKEGGASIVVDAAREDIVPVVKGLNSNKGADIVFECAGTPATFEQSLKIAHRGGKIDVVALYEEPVTWNPGFIASNDLTLIGCGLRWDLPGAVRLMKQGKVNAQSLITHYFPLEKIQEAFEIQQRDKDAVKVILEI
jgi:2-desacetyl-2-hydroxyethyl bacteriochlorophyllide A dehydrogenase